MLYLIAFFFPALALLLAGKPISALFNLILWTISIALWLTLLLAPVGFILWVICVSHAVLAISDAREERRARRIIQASRPR